MMWLVRGKGRLLVEDDTSQSLSIVKSKTNRMIIVYPRQQKVVKVEVDPPE